MKKKLNLKGKNLSLECEEEDPLANSVYSQIGPDGLKFVQDDIKVGKEGLIKFNTGDSNDVIQKLTREDLEFGKLLGKGAAGQVVEGRYRPTNEPVAIKSINAFDREKRHQLMNDIKLLLQNKLKSDREKLESCSFLVKLYGAFYEEGSVKVVLELMDLGSLRDIINMLKTKEEKKEPAIEEPVLAKMCQQILNGFIYLHVVGRQIHRDIKPENILINTKGQVKLTDFGISKELDETGQFCMTHVGTVTYMSPERAEGKKYNYSSDIWSFGLVVIELATGNYPYPSNKTYIEMVQAIMNDRSPQLPENGKYSPELQDFVNRCLHKESKKRASAIELLSHPWILKNACRTDSDVKKWLDKVRLGSSKKPEEASGIILNSSFDEKPKNDQSFQVRIHGVSEFRKKNMLPKLDEIDEDA